jgi:hypothetical protein
MQGFRKKPCLTDAAKPDVYRQRCFSIWVIDIDLKLVIHLSYFFTGILQLLHLTIHCKIQGL